MKWYLAQADYLGYLLWVGRGDWPGSHQWSVDSHLWLHLRTLVAEAVTAHGLCLEPVEPCRRPSLPGGLALAEDKGALPWLPLTEGILGKWPSPHSLPPAPHFQPWRGDLLADGFFWFLSCHRRIRKEFGVTATVSLSVGNQYTLRILGNLCTSCPRSQVILFVLCPDAYTPKQVGGPW